MLFILLSHQWKSFWRSRSAGKGLAVQIFLGFITLYLLAVAISVGIFLQSFIRKGFPGQDPIWIFCGFILYYFFADILMRFMLQELPVLTIQPYLVQSIRKRQLIRFLNIRSLFNFFNLLPLVLFVPFTLRAIGPAHGAMAAVCFLFSLIFLTVFNHFIILYIKRKIILSSWWMVAFFVIIAVLGLSDYFHFFSIRQVSSVLFSRMLLHYWLIVIPIGMAVAAFVNNDRFLYKNLYLDDAGDGNKRKLGADYSFLDRFGAMGELISLEVKLLLRNKRPRAVLMMSSIFLFYGFIFYKPESIAKGSLGILLLGAVFITGIFVMYYGQFLFAWQSSQFDGLMSSNLRMRIYIKSKFMLMIAVSSVIFLGASLYGILSWKIILVQLSGFLYNIGINTVIVGYFATRSYKAIDISKGATFNYQGLGATQWIYSLIVLLVPMVIYLPFSILVGKWAGIIALGLAGLINLLLQDWWIGILTREFVKRKYAILQGFREK